MIITNKQGYAPNQRNRKSYFPFTNGMRSVEFKGVGANLAQNVTYKDGFVKKQEGISRFKTLPAGASVYNIGGFQKTDGTYQVLYAVKIGAVYKIRAVEEDDGTVVTPTGGAGDVDFTSDIFSFEQINALGAVGNYSATTPLYSWNGAALVAIANAPTLIRGLGRDGVRLATIDDTSAKFSGITVLSASDFTAGTGVNVSGTYSLSIRAPKAIVTAGMGVIVIGEVGSEAHKVIPNAASDNVSADTRLGNYNDRELGVLTNQQACMGKQYVWRVTNAGIMRTNPFNGETENVTDTGKIGRYWNEEYDSASATIGYDSEHETIVCVTKKGAQNDTAIVIDITQKELPISVKPGCYYSCVANINNKLYGGGSREAILDTLFDGTSTVSGTARIFRFIGEWDGLTSAMYWKVMKRLHIFANLSPEDEMTVKLYFDGDTSAVHTETFTTTDRAGSLDADAPYGMYVFGAGSADMETENNDDIRRSLFTKRFSTMCIEVYNNSVNEFEVYDISIEFKTKNKYFDSVSMPSNLF